MDNKEIVCSVIIPLYNKESYIERTIRTVQEQTVSNIEIIVVDDGSTDSSVEVVRGIHDNRVVLVQQKNAGVSAARNAGIRNAHGKYVAFLDADDMWEKDFIEISLDLYQKFPSAKMVCPSYTIVYGDRVVLPEFSSVEIDRECLVHDFFEMASGNNWVCNSSCVMVDSEIFPLFDYWFPETETFYEDFDFWFRIGSRFPVAHSPKVCSHYNRLTESNARKSHTHKIVYSKHYMETLKKAYDEVTAEQQRIWIKEIFDRRQVVYIFSLLLNKKRDIARSEIKRWESTKRYASHKLLLSICSWMPYPVISFVQNMRYRYM